MRSALTGIIKKRGRKKQRKRRREVEGERDSEIEEENRRAKYHVPAVTAEAPSKRYLNR